MNKICKFEKGRVEVELLNEELKGMTHWKPDDPEAKHEVALEVDKGRFFNHFFNLLR